MPSDKPTLNAPGRKFRRNPSGRKRLYWQARADIVRLGFTPRLVALPYDPDNPDHHALIEAHCQRLQAEMLAFAAGVGHKRDRFDGTVHGLSRRYQTDPASPFQRLKHTSRAKDTYTLRIIEAAFGKRALAAIRIADFYRWYDAAKTPRTPGGPERVRRAWGIIKKFRELCAYGVMAELPECERLSTMLRHARFAQPPRRRVAMELAHVEAFVPTALRMDRLSLAIGTALQFETAMRQKDVIGEWEPIPMGEGGTIVLNGHRWVRGLTWADIGTDYVVRKATTKTGAFAAHDLGLCPLVLDLLARVPAEARHGPLIVDERAGRPYATSAYGREWRIVARAAAVPDHVWNMDARAGAITEAEDAGADLDHIRSAAAHTQTATTQRYSRGALGKSRRVAEMRQALRAARNGS